VTAIENRAEPPAGILAQEPKSPDSCVSRDQVGEAVPAIRENVEKAQQREVETQECVVRLHRAGIDPVLEIVGEAGIEARANCEESLRGNGVLEAPAILGRARGSVREGLIECLEEVSAERLDFAMHRCPAHRGAPLGPADHLAVEGRTRDLPGSLHQVVDLVDDEDGVGEVGVG